MDLLWFMWSNHRVSSEAYALLNKACQQHSHNAIMRFNLLTYSVQNISLTECAWEFQSDALVGNMNGR